VDGAAHPRGHRPDDVPRPPRALPPPPYTERSDPAMAFLASTSAALAGEHPRRVHAPKRRRAGQLPEPSAEALGAYVVSTYPQRSYPTLVLGPVSGAVAHLATALGAPWLPQTFRLPVQPPRRCAGDLTRGVDWGGRVADAVLRNEPGIQLSQVVEEPGAPPALRLRLLELPAAYLRFLYERLAVGGTLLVLDCQLRWPALWLGEQHVFQLGGPFARGSWASRVGARRALIELRRELGAVAGRAATSLTASPEAAWGFDPTLADAAVAVAGSLGARVVRMSFADLDALAFVVAEGLARWYEREGARPERLIGELGPHAYPRWAERAAAVPYWAAKPTPAGVRAMKRLSGSRAWHSIGVLADDRDALEAWRRAASHAEVHAWVRQRHGAVGALKRFAPEDKPPLPRLSIDTFAGWARAMGARVGVSIDRRAQETLDTTRPAS
jgi:hypothetical protein